MKALASRRPLVGAVILACLAAGCSPRGADDAAETVAETAQSAAQNTETAAGAAAGAAGAAADAAMPAVVDPAALAALERMSAYLRTLTSFEVQAETTADTVLETGQLVKLPGKVTYRVRRPDGFQIVWDTDRKKRTLYYDGKTFTLHAPRMGYYAQADAPPTIREAVDVVEGRYGVNLPLADLFRWGTDQADASAITSGIVVGPARLDGVETGQYAFRQGDVDWQIFIDAGEKPLPRKIVITTLSDPARPQFAATLDWKENPSLPPAIFAFTPGKDDKRIKIGEEQS
jgi:hypothetical protein